MFSVDMSLIQLKQAYWHMTGHVKQVCIPKRLPEVYIYKEKSRSGIAQTDEERGSLFWAEFLSQVVS